MKWEEKPPFKDAKDGEERRLPGSWEAPGRNGPQGSTKVLSCPSGNLQELTHSDLSTDVPYIPGYTPE